MMKLNYMSIFSKKNKKQSRNSVAYAALLVSFFTFISGAASAGTITVENGGVVRGNGTIVSDLMINSGGALNPGQSPGCLAFNNLDYSGGGTLIAEIGGDTACTDYDHLQVNGTVTLGAVLNLSAYNSYVPVAGNTYQIIDNDGIDQVSGIFTSLEEGDIVTLSGQNLSISYAGGDGNDVVLKALSDQTITFPEPVDQTYGVGSINIAATATSGLSVSFISNSTSVCTVSGSSVSILSVGICSITASQSGDASYNAASNVTQSFIVSQASQAIAFNALADKNLGDAGFNLSATSSSGLTVSFASNTSSICSVSGTSVSLLDVGTCSITASQSGDANYLAASDVTRSFSVQDVTAPVIVLSGDASTTIAQDSNYNDAGATASDNVDGDISANIVTSGSVDTATVGVYTLRYNVSDAAGNAATEVTRTVTVTDQTLPVISRIGDSSVTIAQDTTYTDAGATANDNNDGDITSSIVTVNSVDTSTVGSYTVTYNVADTAGNAAMEVTRTITVTDQTAPVISLVGDSSVTIAQDSTYTDAGASASDNNDGDITSSIVTVNSVDTSTVGNYTVTYNVTDAAGNAAVEVTRTVTVTDQIAPVISLVGDATVTVAQGSSYNDQGATANDNNDGEISSAIVTVNPVDINTVGSYTVTYNVADAAGNAAVQVTRTVIVTDQTAPVVTAPTALTVAAADAGGTAKTDSNIALFLAS
ncbi:MAG: DUF5011 domain-containing protein, partial [Kangiellaceae bacterium]|nr:DUF5011 domain-containing protein [Kangiellaceae bacterium]